MVEKSEKIISSINLENWIWETVERLEKNRSKFFCNLIKDEIKKELIFQKLINEAQEVSELYGELYLKLKFNENRHRLKTSLSGRKPVRSKTLKNNESFIKKSISIRIEKWLWDIAGKVEPNRSLFLKNLFLLKLKNELINSHIIDEATFQENENNDYYLMQISQKMLNKGIC